MKAARIHQFGAPEVIVIDNLPRQIPTFQANRVLRMACCA